MNLGYACVNLTLSNNSNKVTTNRTMVKKTFLTKGTDYASYLSMKNCSDLLNILEIGSFAGASAAAFAKFFPNSKIFCFDINISNFKYSSKQINVYGLDINNKEKVKKILNKIFDQNNFEEFDLIIDDGSHLLSDIIFGFDIFFELVKSGGVYVIEDYKFPNYFQKHKDINEILVDELLKKISNQVYFSSKLLTKEKQMKIFNSIKSIDTFKGNLAESDICFIKKK